MARSTGYKKATARSGLTGIMHSHGCLRCHARFDDACDEFAVDRVCDSCEHGRPRPGDWWGTYEPRACCFVPGNLRELRAHTDAKTRDLLFSNRLGGEGPWYRCSACSRRHPHVRPTVESVAGRLTAWHFGVLPPHLLGTPPEWVLEDLERRLEMDG